MSKKMSTMLGVIANPANLHRFRISIPRSDFDGKNDFTCIVESTSLPAPGPMREVNLWVDGEQVRYPGQPENGGNWTFKVPESDKFDIQPKLDALINEMYNRESGIMPASFTGGAMWRDVLIQSLNLKDEPVHACKLHGCWMKNRNAVNLNAADASQAWKWDYVMVYNWIEDPAK